ncbi:putative acyl-CoA dehydrogenase AidB [Stylophora pistillata]|uniref:Putative acyl-CoA dehydrogenase AidB n=2 Tax=Stylophora pistillata TaxID=50429 RepID=A0A2B4RWJ1_STYPI|nr:putative acyl-CoA dehydrogenase AidB [Stylophora pistillata]
MFRAKITSKKMFPNYLIARKSTVRGGEKALDLDSHDTLNGSVSRDTKFAASKRGTFFQEAPRFGNQFKGDPFLQSYLKRVLPYEVLQEILPDLQHFGHRVATDINSMGRECELQPPKLEHFDAWGQRVDNIQTCQGWRQLHDVSAEEGLISIPYERKYGQWSRIYQAAKLFLFSPSSGLYSCPLAMTDGAAKSIKVSTMTEKPSVLKDAYSRLTSRDPKKFWTSGQWMTERKGGSDVANGTETLAVPQEDGTYRLYGYKWFSSATDANMTLTLARVQNPDGSIVPGTKGISMFYMQTRNQDGKLNHIEVQRLKNKLGTKQLPTAELLLHGSLAYKMSDEGRGVPCISDMLTITRFHNSISAAGVMRRIMSLAQDYCLRRSVFGKLLVEHPLHMQTLARIELKTRAAFLLTMEIAHLLGKQDCNEASDVETRLLRLLTPITKLYTAKQAMHVTSEGVESFGGQGYIEDTGIPGLMRDAQVLPIWEGTTNVLSLDVLRSISKSEGQVLKAFHANVTDKLSRACASRPALKVISEKVQSSMNTLLSPKNYELLSDSLPARDLAFSLARIYMASLLIEHASWEEAEEQDIEAAKRWCQQDLTPVLTQLRHNAYDAKSSACDLALVMKGHPDFTRT